MRRSINGISCFLESTLFAANFEFLGGLRTSQKKKCLAQGRQHLIETLNFLILLAIRKTLELSSITTIAWIRKILDERFYSIFIEAQNERQLVFFV